MFGDIHKIGRVGSIWTSRKNFINIVQKQLDKISMKFFYELSHEVKHRNILFTGLPGCGKSTIIEKVVQRINRPSTGFFTREIRERGRRVGFSITTRDGEHGILAHIDIRSRIRVGRYGVNIRDIDEIAVSSMFPENDNVILVVDEIGKMEKE